MKRWRGLALGAALSCAFTLLPAFAAQAEANEILTATTAVNIRSGPGTGYQVLGVVYWGYTVEATGGSVNGWTPVYYRGQTAYVASQYFTGASSAPQTQTGGATGQATTTAALNVRTGPSTNYDRLTTLPYGTVVTLTGTTSGSFRQIEYAGSTAWVHGDWLALAAAPATPEPTPEPAPDPIATPDTGAEEAPEPAGPDEPAVSEPDPAPAPDPEPDPEPEPEPEPVVTGQKMTAAALNFRSGPGLSYSIYHVIPDGTVVDVTDRQENGFVQIVRQGQAGWVSLTYLTDVPAPAPAAPGTPAVTGQLYTTEYLNVRSGPGTSYSIVTVLSLGSAVDITGNKEGVWQQIVLNGAVRWVSSDYLSATQPVVEPLPNLNTTPAQAQEIARGQVAARGWGDDQFQCLVSLWTKESGWRMNAENPYSGAYGIPQALPGDKMASAGSDWRTNAATQIAWGLGYIAQRYGNPCGAWSFWLSHNWY